MSTTYHEVRCKSLLHKISNKSLPFKWGVNPYRGCLHSCSYCYARYTHEYLGLNPDHGFNSVIHVKINAVQILRKELSNPRWRKERINLGSVCDPYQPVESTYKLSRGILQEILRHRTPVTVATKSPLILRDKDLLERLSEEKLVEVVFSIGTVDDNLREQTEPFAPPISQRLAAIQELRKSDIRVGVLAMPIIPLLGDSFSKLNNLFRAIAKAQASFVIPGILYLTGPSRERFLSLVKKSYPELYNSFADLYKTRSPQEYKIQKQKEIRSLIDKYQLASNTAKKETSRSRQQPRLDAWLKKE